MATTVSNAVTNIAAEYVGQDADGLAVFTGVTL